MLIAIIIVTTRNGKIQSFPRVDDIKPYIWVLVILNGPQQTSDKIEYGRTAEQDEKEGIKNTITPLIY